MSSKPVTLEWAVKTTAKLLAQELKERRVEIVSGPVKVWMTDGMEFGVDTYPCENVFKLPRDLVRGVLQGAAHALAESIKRHGPTSERVAFSPLDRVFGMSSAIAKKSRVPVRMLSVHKRDLVLANGELPDGIPEDVQMIWRFGILAFAVRPQQIVK